MKMECLKSLYVFATMCISIAAGAQSPTTDSVARKPLPSVTIQFFAEHDHSPVSEIAQGDLSVLDNQKPTQSIVSIQHAKELPLRLGILFDTSGSQRDSGLFGMGVKSLLEFVQEELKDADDKVFVASFEDGADGTEFLSRDQFLKTKVDLRLRGATAFFDAVIWACKQRMGSDSKWPTRRMLVVLSDGDDNASRARLADAISAAQETGTEIFAMSTSEDGPDHGAGNLKRLAEATGGRAFLRVHGSDLTKDRLLIGEQIENTYSVTFVPPDEGEKGQFRSVEIRPSSGRKFKVRAARGYYLAARTE